MVQVVLRLCADAGELIGKIRDSEAEVREPLGSIPGFRTAVDAEAAPHAPRQSLPLLLCAGCGRRMLPFVAPRVCSTRGMPPCCRRRYLSYQLE
jgi:hypothetical protein